MAETEISRAVLVTPPAAEPVTLAQAKKQLELASSDTAHDAHLALLIQAAREQWEADTDSCCLTQTWKVYAEEFDDDELYLPKRPIQSITHVKYYDASNVQQTLSTSVYSLDDAERAVRLDSLQVWPAVYDRFDAITITFVAGYTSAAAVPAIHKQAILLLIGKYFENRDLQVNDVIFKDAAYEALVTKFMRSNYP
jgi:uncharacterized phiE125 gp8 family phage protein